MPKVDFKKQWELMKASFNEWSEDRVPRLSASLAFYTMLSIAPLLIITMKIVGVIVDKENAQGQIQSYADEVMGTKGAEAIQDMLANASQSGSGVLATIVSVAVLLFSASGVFGELQDSLNTIFEVKPRPDRGIMGIIKDRFLSMTLVLGVAFLLLVSLILSTVLSGMTKTLGGDQLGWLWSIIHFVVAIGVITSLFALMFKYLPDVKLQWRDVWRGAILTAVLFTIGKFLLAWYLGRGSTTSIYGAAGSLVAVLLWVYYSAQILFFGAEYTQVYAQKYGSGLKPAENAVAMSEETRKKEGMPHAAALQAAAREQGKATRSTAPSRVQPEYATSQDDAQEEEASSGSFVRTSALLAAGFVLGRWLKKKQTTPIYVQAPTPPSRHRPLPLMPVSLARHGRDVVIHTSSRAKVAAPEPTNGKTKKKACSWS